MDLGPLLIVCYTFPPELGIGGRRWAKFAKYLSRKGHTVHIITRKVEERTGFNSAHFGLENVVIHEIEDHYPDILTKQVTSLSDKLKYRYWSQKLEKKHPGSIYDRSIFMKGSLQAKATELIKEFKIRKVIVTIAPFRLAEYLLDLKKQLDFELTVDLRDPWTWGEGYGYSSISRERIDVDRQVEKRVMQGADHVISPSENLISHLKRNHPVNKSSHYQVIPHGIDTDVVQRKPASSASSFKGVYAGTLYIGYDKFLNRLCDSLDRMLENNDALLGQFSLDLFCTNRFEEYAQIVSERGWSEKIHFYGRMDEKELFERLPSYDFSLIFFPENFKDFITTKFYELIYLGLSILYVGHEGELSDFIQQKGVGSFIPFDKMSEFETGMNSLQSIEMDSEFDIDSFTYERLTGQLQKIIV